MKGKITALFLCFSLVFVAGIGIAYYNTRAYGFDEDAKIIAKDDEKISIFDFNIYYDDINNTIEKAKEIIPDRQYTMHYGTV